MKDYSVTKSWTKFYTVQLPEVANSIGYVKILWEFKNGEVLFVTTNGWDCCLVSYDPIFVQVAYTQLLHIQYGKTNAQILFRLKSTIASIRQKSMPVSIYYTKIKTLWDQYDSLVASTEACICGAGKHMMERLERDRAMEFLQGLHDRFSNLRSRILTIEPFPTALRIFNLVQQEEEQQNISATPLPTVDATALNTNRHFPSLSRPRASKNKRQRPHCDFCNKHGHVRDKCYRLHGFPTQNNSLPVAAAATAMPTESSSIQPAIPALSADQYARLLALINPPTESAQLEHRANLSGRILTTSFVDPWFIDSGATHHICNSLHFFTSYKPVKTLIQMQLPDGSFSVDRVTKQVIGQANFVSGLYHLQIHQRQQYSKKIDLISTGTPIPFLSTLQKLQSDNGSEFLSRDMQTWFKEHGIHHKRSCVSTPQQNGVAEHAKLSSDNDIPYLMENDVFYEDYTSVAPTIPMLDASSTTISPISSRSDTNSFIPTTGDDNTSIGIESTSISLPSSNETTADVAVSNPTVSAQDAVLRRSTREHHRPSHLKDYICSVNKCTSNSPYPITNYISFDKFTPQYRAFLSSVIVNDEPRTFTEAIKIPVWRDVIVKEHTALQDNDTFTITTLPPGKSAIGCKWVVKIKYRPDGTIERCKARLVAKGYTQQEGIDYHDTFAPVTKLVIVRALLSIAAINNWPLHQLDVNSFFTRRS
ncbi:uncharacterized protein LOC113330925 [Papaver somniferum]|uniref:uncharacterized protein LOC113330925 n=1 Tax=Papaver somniferum TaxID=3469 RepID=UPI000E704618|nr:uncharacterized protein LOC113330925 [Papaver somniferum]